MTRHDFLKTIARYSMLLIPSFILADEEVKKKLLQKGLSVEQRKSIIKQRALQQLKAIESLASQTQRITHRAFEENYIVESYNICEGGCNEFLGEAGFHLETHTNTTIEEIYNTERSGWIDYYPPEFAERLYPLKMPTQDYYPYEYELGTIVDDAEVKAIDWLSFYILHFPNDTMLIGLEHNLLYLKQVGKNVIYINVAYPI